MRLALACFLVALLAADLSAATPRAPRPQPDLDKLKADARKREEANYQGTPLLKGAFKMQDVCRLVNEKGKLVVKSDLPNSAQRSGQYRIEIEGMPGMAIVTMSFRGRGPGLNSFNLRYVDWSDPQAIQIDTQIDWNPQYISLSRNNQNTNGNYFNLNFTQGAMYDPTGNGSPTTVQFAVSAFDRNVRTPVNVQAFANDFVTLRRQHRATIEQHLRPLLREMQWESLMAADSLWAWQVFADEWKPSAALQEKIDKILARLDVDEFRERELAQKDLQTTGREGALVVYHMDRKKLSAQQNMATDTFLSAYLPLSPTDAGKLRRDTEFLLDCLYNDEAPVREAAMKHLERATQTKFDVRIAAEPEKRASQIENIRRQLSGASTRPSSNPATTRPAKPATRPA